MCITRLCYFYRLLNFHIYLCSMLSYTSPDNFYVLLCFTLLFYANSMFFHVIDTINTAFLRFLWWSSFTYHTRLIVVNFLLPRLIKFCVWEYLLLWDTLGLQSSFIPVRHFANLHDDLCHLWAPSLALRPFSRLYSLGKSTGFQFSMCSHWHQYPWTHRSCSSPDGRPYVKKI